MSLSYHVGNLPSRGHKKESEQQEKIAKKAMAKKMINASISIGTRNEPHHLENLQKEYSKALNKYKKTGTGYGKVLSLQPKLERSESNKK